MSNFRLDIHFHLPQPILDMVAALNTPSVTIKEPDPAPAVSPTKEKREKNKPTPAAEVKPAPEVVVDPPPPVEESVPPESKEEPVVDIDTEIRTVMVSICDGGKRDELTALLSEFGLKKAGACPKTKKPELLKRMKALV